MVGQNIDPSFYLPHLRQEQEMMNSLNQTQSGLVPANDSQIAGTSLNGQSQTINKNGRMMILGLNQHYNQIRSHSTEKQSTTFMSNLEGKVTQMGQGLDDSSNMIGGGSMGTRSTNQNSTGQKRTKQSHNLSQKQT
mmetsp:Transcript_12511/g.12286  ORF Transcript_12511/g.12286 Transcript_12511/m.12286 type:complete len:136 (-) Transcript_12511:69-476(-)